MSKCSIVGKNNFVSKRTGKDCYVLHMVQDFPANASNGKGKMTREQFVDVDVYNSITVPCEAEVSYNYRGYVDCIKVVR